MPPVVVKSSQTEVRCQACWLKLCLIGYNLDADQYLKLRSRLPKVVKKQLPEDPDKKKHNLLPHRGEILEFNRQVPLSRPLFDGFGDGNVNNEDKSEASNKGVNKNHVVHERLPNGWMKKAVKRLELGGKWEMFLITPDQKMLKTPSDLKLYIAKSGAVIDANIVNFALPKKTSKVDKLIQKKKGKDNNVVVEKSSKENEVILPKSSRRETKLPQRFRDESPEVTKKVVVTKKTPTKKVAEKPPKVQPRLPQRRDEDEDDDDDEEDDLEDDLIDMDDFESQSEPKKQKVDLSTIGMGTFSIDREAVRVLPSGSMSDLRFKKSKRLISCKKCVNCLKEDCKRCIYCKDRKSNGGKGHLKKVCLERRCLNPLMPGLPAMSTYLKSDYKRSYVRTATAVATKSVPPPPSSSTATTASSSTTATTVIIHQEAEEQPEQSPVSVVNVSYEEEPKVLVEEKGDEDEIGDDESGNEDELLSRTIPEPPMMTRKYTVPGDGTHDRPKLSFAALIALALDNLPERKGTLPMIYSYLMDRFPYFKTLKSLQWQNSIRHNLSLHKEFVRGEKERKGCFWRINSVCNPEDIIFKKGHRTSVEEDKKFSSSNSNDGSIDLPPVDVVQRQQETLIRIPILKEKSPQVKKMARKSRNSIEEFLQIGPSSEKTPAKVLSGLDQDGRK